MEELVIIQDSKALTTSRKIAEKFNKDHKTVLRAINLLECSEEFNKHNFAPISYLDSMNREQVEYVITRDGFVFLVMGFTGKEAAKFKEAFISAFNKIEQQLKTILQPSEDEIILRAISTLQTRVEEQAKKLEMANKVIEIQAPKVLYVNEVLSSENLIAITVIAKELGMSAIALNNSLNQKGIQYRQNDTWVLYSKYQDQEFTKTKTHTFYDSENRQRTSIQTYWTEKGRAFIHSVFNGKLQNLRRSG